jgi:hypothetical protein
VNNMLIKCWIGHTADVRRISYNIHVIQVSRVILQPQNTCMGFPKVNIRCGNQSGRPERPGEGQGTYSDYPNIRKGGPSIGRVILNSQIACTAFL